MNADFKSLGRMSLATALCVLLVEQPLLAGAPLVKKPVELQGDARVLHALNRFTFGPRPGEVAAVEAVGLKKWFELQLDPGQIDDSKLDARLEQYPAMQLSIGQLTSRYPGPQAVRAMENGRVPLPSEPTARALAMDEIAFYKMQKDEKAGKDALAQAGAEKGAVGHGNTGGAGGGVAGGVMAAGRPLTAKEIAPEPMMAAGGVGRARGGFERGRMDEILAQPADGRFRMLLAMPAEELATFRQSLKPKELAQLVEGMSPVQKETLIALPGAVRMVALESMESRLVRDMYSDRQLEAVMTDFWLNHFNVYLRKNGQEPYLIPTYERDTIRPHALGRFEDLLVATAESPAMLMYLDNWQSTGPDSAAAGRVNRIKEMRPNGPIAKKLSAGLNENYGRELMELHTLGVGGGYTQADVTAVAKVFTGWTIDRPYAPTNEVGGGFVFDERKHEPGAKTVLGKTIPEGGEREGLEVLHMLATSPATAKFISTKLAVRFVSDVPPPALVERMTQSFSKSDGDIKAVLRTMFNSPEMWAPEVERAKVKTPVEFVVSAVRAGGMEVTNGQALVMSLEKLGMPLYGMQTPNGYSWMKDEWVSTGALVSRMNFALVLADGRVAGTRVDWGRVVAEGAGVKNASFDGVWAGQALKEKRLEAALVGAAVSERTRQAVLGQAGDLGVAEQAATQFDLTGGRYRRGLGRMGVGVGVGPSASPEEKQVAVMAGLLMGSPEFQRR